MAAVISVHRGRACGACSSPLLLSLLPLSITAAVISPAHPHPWTEPSRRSFELLERLGARRGEVPVVGVAEWTSPLLAWLDLGTEFAAQAGVG